MVKPERPEGGEPGLRVEAGTRAPDEDSDAFYARKQFEDAEVYLGCRIPRKQDLRLAGLIYELRRKGIKVTKTDLVRLALDDLPDDPTSVHPAAPRGTGVRLWDGSSTDGGRGWWRLSYL